jgi:sortase A
MTPGCWRAWRWLERLLVLLAILAFGTVGLDLVRAELERAAISPSLPPASRWAAPPSGLQPVTADVVDVVESLPKLPAPPAKVFVGELEIPRVNLSTLVFDGPNPEALRQAAGHVRGTPLPWEAGNSAVAGHRDSVFRELRDVRPGDDIRFTTSHGRFDYRVTRAFAVYPNEVWVLGKDAAQLTLITCFPFRWVGTAPERWIIQAQRISR